LGIAASRFIPWVKLHWRVESAGVFKSVDDLKAAINRFIAEHNKTQAKPFIWKADPDEIIAARNRGFQMLESIHYGFLKPARA
jgi:hypothetical protein